MRRTLVTAFLIAAIASCMTVVSCSGDENSPTTPETPTIPHDPQTELTLAPSMPTPASDTETPWNEIQRISGFTAVPHGEEGEETQARLTWVYDDVGWLEIRQFSYAGWRRSSIIVKGGECVASAGECEYVSETEVRFTPGNRSETPTFGFQIREWRGWPNTEWITWEGDRHYPWSDRVEVNLPGLYREPEEPEEETGEGEGVSGGGGWTCHRYTNNNGTDVGVEVPYPGGTPTGFESCTGGNEWRRFGDNIDCYKKCS